MSDEEPGPLDHFTTEEICDELKKRFDVFVIGGALIDREENEHGIHGNDFFSYFHGPNWVAVTGVASLLLADYQHQFFSNTNERPE